MARQVLQWALAAVLVLSGVGYAVNGSRNLGVYLVWALGVCSTAYALTWRQVDVFCAQGVGRALKLLVLVGAALYCAVLAYILIGQFQSASVRESRPVRAVIVLGCGLRGEAPTALLVDRLEAALAYYENDPAVLLVVSGGQLGPNEAISEAEAMRRWLVQHGVPEEQILCEAASTSTEENFRFSRAVLEAHGLSPQEPLRFVTNGFHCCRAALYAAAEGYTDIQPLAARIPLSQILPCYLREVCALVEYAVFKSPRTGALRRWLGVPGGR